MPRMRDVLGALGLALARKAAPGVVFPRSGGLLNRLVLGRSGYNYAAVVGDGTGSNLATAPILWLARAMTGAPVQVVRPGSEGRPQPIPNHPLTRLLRRPNPYYSGVLLETASLVDWLFHGNAYWLQRLPRSGPPVELWWLPSSMVRPRWPENGSAYISHYEYRPLGNAASITLQPEEVVHFRYGLSGDMRTGVSPLATLVREIFTDDEAANFSAAVLRRLGVPGWILTVDDEQAEVDEASAEEIKDSWRQQFTNDSRGDVVVLTAKMRAQRVSFSPQEMDLKMLRRVPEERVCAVLGIPPIVVGLGVGLEHATYSNYATAQETAYENCVIPTQRLWAADLETQLLPAFEGPASGLSIAYDLSQVRVLQEDTDKLHTRAWQDYAHGVISLNEARELIGKKPVPNGDVYRISLTDTLVPVGQLGLPPPEPEPMDDDAPDAQPPDSASDDGEDGEADQAPATSRPQRRGWTRKDPGPAHLPVDLSPEDLDAAAAYWRAHAPDRLADLVDAAEATDAE